MAMFQSTQSLTFRTIASLGHFKIHPPLPLTPRESTQLLNLLTTSFRRQLDREHGAVRSEGGANSNASASFNSSKLAPVKHQRHSQSRPDVRIPTDRHMQLILTNPLFKDVEKDLVPKNQHLRDPMKIFDEACAKGFMKVEYAAACLKAKKRKIIQSSALSVRDAMKLSGAGSKTLKWMLSSGVANNNSFLEDEAFSEILVDFMVAEEQESVIWTWLETLVLEISSASTKPATVPSVRNAARLLYFLVKAQISGSASLDIAFRSLGRVENMISGLENRFRPVLKGAGGYLYKEIVNQHASHSRSSPDMFDLFLSIVSKSLSFRNETALPNLLLYHPTKPDAEPALKFLKKVKEIVSTASDPESRHMVLRDKHYNDTRIIYLGLDTARFLLERDQHTKAQWVMTFLEETYGKQLGLSQKDLFSLRNQVQAEASSLELLNSLSLA
jgi:hypothetical protein